MIAVVNSTRVGLLTLDDALILADSGTWGDEASPQTGSPVLRSTNIQDDLLNLHDPAWRVIPEGDIERRKLSTGDIIITKSSGSEDHIGKCGFFCDPQNGYSYYFSNFILRLRTNPERLWPRYLFYWLTSARGRSEVRRMNSTTSGLRNISVPQYREQKLPIPFLGDWRRSLAEQKRIAAILDKADALRRKQRAAHEALLPIWISSFRERFGNVVANDRKWPVVSIGEAGAVQLGRQRAPHYQSGKHTHPYVRVANVFEDRIDLSDVLSMDFDERDFAQYLLRPGDILLNEGQSTELVGRPAIWQGEMEGCCFQNTLVRFRPPTASVDPEYALAVFLEYFKKGEFAKISTKTSSVAHLGASRFAAMPFPLPPIQLQHEFGQLRRKLRVLQRRSAECQIQLNNLFSSLVQRAFRGEL